MLKKIFSLLTALCLLLGSALAEDAPLLVDWINAPKENTDFAFAEDAELLEIIFPQILDSDAALIRCGGETLLLDCGSTKMSSRVINMLEQLGVTRLDRVINTHPHYDHIQGIAQLAEAVEIGEFDVCFTGEITKHLPVALAVCEQYGIPVKLYADGEHLTLGRATLDAWLKGDEAWGLNDRSAQWRIQFGDRTALFAADAVHNAQQRLVEVIPPELLDIDILKYPHHGNEILNESFFLATSPLLAVITNNGGQGKARGYLRARKVPYACTVPGYVSLTTDGRTWLAQRLPMDKPVTVTSRPDIRKFQ